MKITASRLSPLASRLSPLALVCACVISSAQAASADSPFNYTWLEAGFSRLDFTDIGKFDGGHLRGSWDIGENFYLLGGYNTGRESWTVNYPNTRFGGPGTDHIKVTAELAQTEFGFGGYFSLASKLDFYGDLTFIHLEDKGSARLTFTDGAGATFLIDKDNDKDRIFGGKLMAGLRAKPTHGLELWGRIGYLRWEEETLFLRKGSAVGNVGVQLQFTPNIGLVGEAELYRRTRLYRTGLRISF